MRSVNVGALLLCGLSGCGLAAPSEALDAFVNDAGIDAFVHDVGMDSSSTCAPSCASDGECQASCSSDANMVACCDPLVGVCYRVHASMCPSVFHDGGTDTSTDAACLLGAGTTHVTITAPMLAGGMVSMTDPVLLITTRTMLDASGVGALDVPALAIRLDGTGYGAVRWSDGTPARIDVLAPTHQNAFAILGQLPTSAVGTPESIEVAIRRDIHTTQCSATALDVSVGCTRFSAFDDPTGFDTNMCPPFL